jgi:hypothetical protein
VPLRDGRYVSAFGLQLGKRRRLLLRRPLPTTLDPSDNLYPSHR